MGSFLWSGCAVGAAVLLSGTLGAQSPVSISMTTATTVTLEAQSATQLYTAGVPSGVTGGGGGATTFTLDSDITALWLSAADKYAALATWDVTAYVGPAAGAAARQLPAEVLVTLNAAVPTPVTIEVTRELAMTAGAGVATFGIDVGDDGSEEVSETGGQTALLSAVLGPQPFQIRMRAAVDVAATGFADLTLALRVEPLNSIVLSQAAVPCRQDVMYVVPTFLDRGVEVSAFTVAPQVVVFGFAPQGLVLPPLVGGGACTLLPSPDVALYVPIGQPLQVPLPAAVRPVTAWIQSVAVTAEGLTTTNAYFLSAF